MAGGCLGDTCAAPSLGLQRRLLGVVLVINTAMFVIEAAAGWGADSVALQADALDFLGDSLNYAAALFVLTKSVAWRAGAALIKGCAMLAFGVFVLGATAHNAVFGAQPEAPVMGAVGLLALGANLGSALLLFRFRAGDANLRAVWLCSRNDAIGNLAVLAAAGGVAASGGPWPDLAVGLVMASLAVWAGQSVLRQALAELARDRLLAAE
jgi:Co/Zn/Cd efflux system component